MVPGNVNNAFLDNLIPDTPYSVSVTALYADGEGSPVKDNGKTRKSSKNPSCTVYIQHLGHVECSTSQWPHGV